MQEILVCDSQTASTEVKESHHREVGPSETVLRTGHRENDGQQPMAMESRLLHCGHTPGNRAPHQSTPHLVQLT